MQQRIINRVESDEHYKNVLSSTRAAPENTPTDAIIAAARQIAGTIQAKAIVSFSLRGSTVLRAAKGRPGVPILGISPFKETARQLVMSWGVYPELPQTGSYFSNTSEEELFDYDNCKFYMMKIHHVFHYLSSALIFALSCTRNSYLGGGN